MNRGKNSIDLDIALLRAGQVAAGLQARVDVEVLKLAMEHRGSSAQIVIDQQNLYIGRLEARLKRYEEAGTDAHSRAATAEAQFSIALDEMNSLRDQRDTALKRAGDDSWLPVFAGLLTKGIEAWQQGRGEMMAPRKLVRVLVEAGGPSFAADFIATMEGELLSLPSPGEVVPNGS